MRGAGGGSRCRARWWAGFLAAVGLTGCSHFPLNQPLAGLAPDRGYRVGGQPAAPVDELVVVLTISGGGSRAAAFGYGVLEEMRRTTTGGGTPLLAELDVVSAVSGGSILAAFYALRGERTFEEFVPRFLERNVQGVLTRRLFAPGNWPRLLAPNFERVDLLAELLDRELFDGATFADLEARRPFTLVNATDMTRGVPFEFTQDRFDPMCSDLSSFPVGRAVAASSSVPVVFTPVTLENYGWQACGYAGSPTDPRADSFRDPARRRWVHLQDGGLADNLGLDSLVGSVLRPEADCSAERLDPGGRPVVVIVIDAVGDLDRRSENRKRGPSLPKTLQAAVNIPMDANDERGLAALPAALDSWLERTDRCAGGDETGAERRQRLYRIVLDFESVALFDRPASLRLRRMQARLRLDPEDLAMLRRTGSESLRRHPELTRLLADHAPGQRLE